MSGSEPDRDDETLRRLFAELRERDRRRAPAFEAVLASARSRPARPRARLPMLAAAAVLLLAAGGTVVLRMLHRREPQFSVTALGSWRSPTAFLLRMHGTAFLDSLPSVSASVINLDALVSVRAPSSMP